MNTLFKSEGESGVATTENKSERMHNVPKEIIYTNINTFKIPTFCKYTL